MNVYVKRAARISSAACAATGVVALSALAASGAAVGAIWEGFKSAKDVMQKILADQEHSDATTEDKATTECDTATKDDTAAEGNVVVEETSSEEPSVVDAEPVEQSENFSN